MSFKTLKICLTEASRSTSESIIGTQDNVCIPQINQKRECKGRDHDETTESIMAWFFNRGVQKGNPSGIYDEVMELTMSRVKS
jgi:hypothetical protein